MKTRAILPVWPALAVLALAASVLGASWGSIPPRWPVHWDAGGHPNGWAERDAAGVYGLLVLGAGVVVVLELVARLRGRAPASVPAVEALRVASLDFMRAIAFSIAALLSFLAVDLPLGPRLSPAVLAAVCALPVIAAIVFGAVRVFSVAREVRKQSPSVSLHGPFYSDANDARLWVPKPGGLGYTINFAHPLGWPTMALVLIVPIALAVVSTLWR